MPPRQHAPVDDVLTHAAVFLLRLAPANVLALTNQQQLVLVVDCHADAVLIT